jgi:hypothetical protein
MLFRLPREIVCAYLSEVPGNLKRHYLHITLCYNSSPERAILLLLFFHWYFLNVLKSRYSDIDADYRAAFYHLHKTKVLSGRKTRTKSGNNRRWLITQSKTILEMTLLVMLICQYVSFHNSEVKSWNLIEFCNSMLSHWGKAEDLIILLLPLAWAQLNLFSSRRSVMSYLRSKYVCFSLSCVFLHCFPFSRFIKWI